MSFWKPEYATIGGFGDPTTRYPLGEHMTKEEIDNIYLHITGRAEGIVMAGGKAHFPVMFAEAILKFNLIKRQWVGLTDEEWAGICDKNNMLPDRDLKEEIEAKLKEKNT